MPPGYATSTATATARYRVLSEVVDVADVLIRNVDDEVVRGIDTLAERMGLSRNELLRREIVKVARVTGQPVTRDELQRSLELLADLGNESVMAQAW